jgi:hypothetical protein
MVNPKAALDSHLAPSVRVEADCAKAETPLAANIAANTRPHFDLIFFIIRRRI